MTPRIQVKNFHNLDFTGSKKKIAFRIRACDALDEGKPAVMIGAHEHTFYRRSLGRHLEVTAFEGWTMVFVCEYRAIVYYPGSTVTMLITLAL